MHNHPKSAHVCTKGSNLNIRNAPSLNAQVLFTVPNGTRLMITGNPIDGFYPIEVNNYTGFASVEWICICGNAPAEPTLPIAPAPQPPVSPVIPPIGIVPPIAPPIAPVPPPIGIMPGLPTCPPCNCPPVNRPTPCPPIQECAATMTQLARVKTQGNALHMRAQPSMNGEIIARMPNGSRVLVLREQGDWYYIYWNHQLGWAHRDFITFDN